MVSEVQTCRRLIQKQNVGLLHNGSREHHLLRFAAAQRLGTAISPGGNSPIVQDALDRLEILR